jgi:hypothetical protein
LETSALDSELWTIPVQMNFVADGYALNDDLICDFWSKDRVTEVGANFANVP